MTHESKIISKLVPGPNGAVLICHLLTIVS